MDMQKHFLYKTELERILFMREIIIFYIYCIPTMMSEYWANPKIKNRFLQFTVTQLKNGWRVLVFISIGIFKLTLYNFLVCIYKYNFVNRRKYNRTIENRIYREELTRKKCKTAIFLYCFHTAGVLHIFMLYNLLGPGISFYRKSKITVKRKPNYGIGWFHNWPMIISHRLYAFHFTNDDFPL